MGLPSPLVIGEDPNPEKQCDLSRFTEMAGGLKEMLVLKKDFVAA